MTPLKTLLAACCLLLALAAPAGATGCFPVAGLAPRLVPAAWQEAALPAGATVRLTFLGHASFLIETVGGASAVTDFNGYYKAPFTPDIVTMNNAHSSHYTTFVDPAVKYVLRGWNPAGGMATHDVVHRDLRVRNIPTSVHGRSGAEANTNSIFVFEAEDLCIAHLGHLHHLLTPQHLAELGMIDVVLVPIDGAYTMSQEEMVEVIGAIGAPLVVPMHYFNRAVLERFLAALGPAYEVAMSASPEILLSRATLPPQERPRVAVLPGP